MVNKAAKEFKRRDFVASICNRISGLFRKNKKESDQCSDQGAGGNQSHGNLPTRSTDSSALVFSDNLAGAKYCIPLSHS